MRSLSSGSGDTTAYPASSKLRYYGYTAYNLSNSPASFVIRHGVVALDTITLAAKESRNNWPEAGGQACPNGLSVDRVSGSAQVAVYFSA